MAERGRDHQVTIALDDQRWAMDPGKALEGRVVRDAPLDDRVVLRVAEGQGRGSVAILSAGRESAQELHSLRLARIGVSEHDVEEVLGLALSARGGGDVLPPAVHQG